MCLGYPVKNKLFDISTCTLKWIQQKPLTLLMGSIFDRNLMPKKSYFSMWLDRNLIAIKFKSSKLFLVPFMGECFPGVNVQRKNVSL